MSMQGYLTLKKQEPYWFTRVRETFGDLIYDTRVEVLGIDTYRRITFNYDLETTTNKIVLDYYQKSFIKWRE